MIRILLFILFQLFYLLLPIRKTQILPLREVRQRLISVTLPLQSMCWGIFRWYLIFSKQVACSAYYTVHDSNACWSRSQSLPSVSCITASGPMLSPVLISVTVVAVILGLSTAALILLLFLRYFYIDPVTLNSNCVLLAVYLMYYWLKQSWQWFQSVL